MPAPACSWANLVSRQALERLADRVEARQAVHFPIHAGVYWIVGAAIDPGSGNVGLIINPSAGGRSGLVSYPPGATSGPDGGPFYNRFMGMSLGKRWEFVVED